LIIDKFAFVKYKELNENLEKVGKRNFLTKEFIYFLKKVSITHEELPIRMGLLPSLPVGSRRMI